MSGAVSAAERRREAWIGWSFVAPFALCYALLLVVPVLRGFWLSLHAQDLLSGIGHFVGLANFSDLLQDKGFWRALRNTLAFAGICTPLFVVVGLALAMALNRPQRSAAFFRAVFFGTTVLSVTVVTLVWRLVLMPERGLLASSLANVGLSVPPPLATEALALPTVALVTLWWGVGMPMMLFLAALQQVPQEQYEAAALDNASAWQRLRFITLPAIRRTVILVAIVQLIGQLQVFGQVQLMTAGGPAGSTRSLVMFTFEALFDQWALGYSAAAAQLLFALMVIGVSLQRVAERQGASS